VDSVGLGIGRSWVGSRPERLGGEGRVAYVKENELSLVLRRRLERLVRLVVRRVRVPRRRVRRVRVDRVERVDRRVERRVEARVDRVRVVLFAIWVV